jgi:CRISPR-associated endonuclease/helicase Cas3
MVVDLNEYKSHKHKELTVHTQGVMNNTMQLTSSDLAKLAAVFHDLGKLNPNFQDKLFARPSKGYGNHAYLSAFGIFSFCLSNQNWLKNYLGEQDFNYKFLALIVIIAKHHGNLPNFDVPLGGEGSNECKQLFEFLEINTLPINEFIKYFEPSINEFEFSKIKDNQKYFASFGNTKFKSKHSGILRYFLSTQFDFSCLIQGDKTDAGDYELDRDTVNRFCQSYNEKLSVYLETLKERKGGNIELNVLRTQIRLEANINLRTLLKKGERVFALTSPTGSGKTLMLLSLAGSIIEETKQSLRCIYSIPFLSITEQVENECLTIFGNEFVQRIDSKSENSEFQKLQEEADKGLDVDKDVITSFFKEDIFAFPFVITTFVRFFETMMSNRNATLLKLPSYSNCIFLIDEIQSLPPRLYSFFVAYLDAFCKVHNSYAIVSTATMPNFTVPIGEAKQLFEPFSYKNPSELLSFDYFKHYLFNRYTIFQEKEIIELTVLKEKIIDENSSVLVILNTIDDSKDLYKLLSEHFSNKELYLLNTHFTPEDRKEKIAIAKDRLIKNENIILISTQLIEAGVDIDFPLLYRDMAILPSIIQSAGRCNRNGKLRNSRVILFNLLNREKVRAELIYRGKDKFLLNNTTQALQENEYSETALFEVQKYYFNQINQKLLFGEHEQKKPEVQLNFVKDIQAVNFEKIGKFRLIDEDFYGEEFRCYISKDGKDDMFDQLLEKNKELKYILATDGKNYAKVKLKKIEIENHLKQMSGQILQIRLKKGQIKPVFLNEHFDLFEISHQSYSFEEGIELGSSNQIL